MSLNIWKERSVSNNYIHHKGAETSLKFVEKSSMAIIRTLLFPIVCLFATHNAKALRILLSSNFKFKELR